MKQSHCDRDWDALEQLSTDARIRFCPECLEQVLRANGPEENQILDVVHEANPLAEDAKLQLFRRADGTIMLRQGSCCGGPPSSLTRRLRNALLTVSPIAVSYYVAFWNKGGLVALSTVLSCILFCFFMVWILRWMFGVLHRRRNIRGAIAATLVGTIWSALTVSLTLVIYSHLYTFANLDLQLWRVIPVGLMLLFSARCLVPEQKHTPWDKRKEKILKEEKSRVKAEKPAQVIQQLQMNREPGSSAVSAE